MKFRRIVAEMARYARKLDGMKMDHAGNVVRNHIALLRKTRKRAVWKT